MKKSVLAIALCLIATSASAADLTAPLPKEAEASQLYTSAKLFGSLMTKGAEVSGTRNSHTDYNDFRIGAGLTAGLRFNQIRTELEVSHFGNTKDKAFDEHDEHKYTKIKNFFNMMVNGYYDFKNKTDFTPYLGGGLGIARIRGKYTREDSYESAFGTKRATHLAWQVGTGLAYKLNEHFEMDIGYRYLDNGSLKFREEGNTLKMKSQIHQVYTGVRFNF